MTPPTFDDSEREINDHILAAMRGIQDLGLRANEAELVQAVHTMQAFVIQHMLQRLGGAWGQWYEAKE